MSEKGETPSMEELTPGWNHGIKKVFAPFCAWKKSSPPYFLYLLCIHCMYHTPMNTFESLDPTKITFWSSKMSFFFEKWNLGFSNFVAKKSLTPNFFRKKVFFPYFFSRKNLHPIIFSKKSLCPQFFSKKILRPPCRLSRPGYPKNFDLSRLHFFYKTAWAQALEN